MKEDVRAFSMTLPREIYDLAKAKAEEEGRSLNKQIGRWIRDALDKREEANG